MAMLVTEGRVKLTDDIRKYIPELAQTSQRVTIDHLLHHTSGYRDWPGSLALAGWRFDDVISWDQIRTFAYHQRTLHREHVLSAFAPLFAGWVSSFAFEVPDAPLADSEGRLDRMCLQFESEKPYLIARWRWPVGFSP